MTRLALIAHAIADVEPAYHAALAPFGAVTVKAFVSPHPGMSSAYTTLGHALRNNGRILPQLVAKYAPGRWDSIVLITWSAGYALARELLAIPADADEIDALVMLDSLHSSSQSAAREIQMAPFEAFARRAVAGEKVFFLGHSDVPVTGYDSTTVAAGNLTAAVPPGGDFIVRAYDTVPGRKVSDYEQEHRNAVRLWGPEAAAEAVARIANQDTGPLTERSPTVASRPPPLSVPWLDTSDFGGAVLGIALEDLNRSPREEGRNASDFIRDNYLKPLGLPEGSSYCAAAVTSWMRRAAERTGLPMPIAGSGGAQMLMRQFKAAGRWVPRAQLTPEAILPGMVFVWDRSDPKVAGDEWKGHTGVAIEGVGEHSVGLVEGNSDRLVEPITRQIYAVTQTERRLDDARLFGAGYLGDMPMPPHGRVTDRLELLTELAQLVVLALVYLQFALRERRDALHDAEVIARLELLAGAVSHTHGAVLDLPAPPPRPLRTPTPVTLDLTQPEPTRPGTTQLIRSDVLEAARREATPTPRRGTL